MRLSRKVWSRQGIELAASFIVVLVVSVVLLGLATAVTYRIFCVSGDKIQQLDESTEKRVEQVLSTGARVAIPDAAKTAKSSASFCGKDSMTGAVFALGIRNDLPDIPDATFDVTCEYVGREVPGQGIQYPYGGTVAVPCDDPGGPWEVQFTPVVTLQPKEKQVYLVAINTPASIETGKHIFNVRVFKTADGSPYGAATIYYTIA